MSHPDVQWKVIKTALSDDDVTLDGFDKFLKKCPGSDLALLFEAVDETDYSLPDWIAALLAFDRWLDENGTSNRPFSQMLGYINCCTQINPPNVSLASLKVIVYESLIEFGFDDKDASHL
ncbi:MAG: hypothetical protein P1U86_12545 [Verrucomicrobiales bacterium]|nr:hypothetical protein [Verrucomicrobiales bacterium]